MTKTDAIAFALMRESVKSEKSKFIVNDKWEDEDESIGITLRTEDDRFFISLRNDGTFDICDQKWADGEIDY